MKREVFLAVTIGFIIGLSLTFFLYKTKLTARTETEIVSPLSNDTKNGVSSTPFPSQSLSLVSPLDQSISKEDKIKITGSTTPLSWVVILGEKGEKVVQADDKGSFETDLLLVSGENEITISSYNTSGEKTEKRVTIIYSTAEI